MLKSTAWKKYATAGNDGSDLYNEYSVKTFNKKYVNLESIILQAKHDQLKSFNAFYQNKITIPSQIKLWQNANMWQLKSDLDLQHRLH